MINSKIIGLITVAGLGGIVAISHAVPAAVPWTVGGIAGVVSGCSLRNEQLRDAQLRNDEARKVALTFQRLYEQNRGLLSINQLSVQSDITLDAASEFLSQLAQAQNAQNIQGPDGPAFQFPHPQNIIEEINKQAGAMVKQNTEQLVAQNQQLIQQLQALSSQRAAAPRGNPEELIAKVARARNHAKTNIVQEEVETEDAWGNLL